MVVLEMIYLVGHRLFSGVPSLGMLICLLIATVTAGLVIGALPEGLLSRLWDWRTESLAKPIRLLGLPLLVGGVLFAWLFPVTSDEIWQLQASQIVANDGLVPFFADYQEHPWLGVQHPPLSPILYGLSMSMFGRHVLVPRLVTLAFAFLTLVVTYFLGKELYDRETGLLAAVLLGTFRLFASRSLVANNDLLVTFFFALTILLTLRLIRCPSPRLACAVGLSIGLGLLTKYTMVLVYPICLLGFGRAGLSVRTGLVIGIVFLISLGILAVWLVDAQALGVYGTQRDTLIYYATAVTGSWYGLKLLLASVFLYLPTSVGLYNLPLLSLGSIAVLRRRDPSDRFLLSYLALVCLPILLTLPVHRYFLICFPGLAIMAARGVPTTPRPIRSVIALSWALCVCSIIHLAAQ